MTREEEERQLRNRADADELVERLDVYIQRCEAEDRHQIIGRSYEPPSDPGDARDEIVERIDREFDQDERALVIQDLQERKDFDDWIREQRIQLRTQDALAVKEQRVGVQQLKADDIDYVSSKTHSEIAERERVRDEVESQLRGRFTDWQKQRHGDRLAALNERNDGNLEPFRASQEREKADFEKPLPWETPAGAQASAGDYMKRKGGQKTQERDFDR